MDLKLYTPPSDNNNNINNDNDNDIEKWSTNYVKSLNYLPHTVDMTTTSTDELPSTITTTTITNGMGDMQDDNDDDVRIVNELPTRKRDLVSKMTHILQSSGASPLPYNVVRSRVPTAISDKYLLEALSANAALVRGNFVLKSSLLYNSSTSSASSNLSSNNASSKNSSKSRKNNNNANNKLSAADASYLLMTVRDVCLILFQKYGWMQRDLVLQAFKEDYAHHMTEEMLDSILQNLARKTINGMEMRLDDDLSMQLLFPNVVAIHQIYWEKKTKQHQHYFTKYEELFEKHNTTKNALNDDSSSSNVADMDQEYEEDEE